MRFALIVVAAWFSSIQTTSLQARFIGNMAFAITDGAVTLMSDFPYQSGYSRYNTYQPSEIRSNTASTLSLITHRHGDHWEPRLFAKTNWKVAGPDDVIKGMAQDRVVALGHQTTFGPIQIERISTPHADVGHHSYVVTWHGKRMYFSGDTESPASLLAARQLDVAFISPWMFRSVVNRLASVDAKRIVIYHHENGETIADCRARCHVPKQGETLRIE